MSSMAYTEGATLLTIDNVCVAYDKPVLKNLCAEVKDIIVSDTAPDGSHITKGQVIAVLGPSGVGKTQFFRCLSGLQKPDSGSVYINNCACGAATCGKEKCIVKAGDVGVVAQSYPLFPHRTIKSNLMVAAKVKEKDEKVALAKIMAYLKEFDLVDHLYHYPRDLSGGQRQRVAIIQQILCSNHFMLMDEPFSGLDPISLEKTAHLIQQVANLDELNTIIVVTHDVSAACAVSDHVWMIGRDHDEHGNVVPGARIVQNFNLIDENLAWQPDITSRMDFMSFVAKLRKLFWSL